MNESTVDVICISEASHDYLRVELIGIEPMTPGLQSRCSPS
jgi:hypothetical protein